MFAERGHEGITIRYIENAAGETRELANYRFGNSEQFWEANLKEICGLLRAHVRQMTELLKHLPPSRQATRVIGGYVRFSSLRPESTQLMVHVVRGTTLEQVSGL